MAEDDRLYSSRWLVRQSQSLMDKGKELIDLSGFRNNGRILQGAPIVELLEKHNVPFTLGPGTQKSYHAPIDVHQEIKHAMLKYYYLDLIHLGIGIEYWLKCIFLKKDFVIHAPLKLVKDYIPQKIGELTEFNPDKTLNNSTLIKNISLVFDETEVDLSRLNKGLSLIAEWRNQIFHLSPLSWGESNFTSELISWTIDVLDTKLKKLSEE